MFCPVVFSSNESHLHFPLAVLHPPAFVPSRRQCLESLRVLTFHVLNNPVSQQAVQRLLGCLISCLSVKLVHRSLRHEVLSSPMFLRRLTTSALFRVSSSASSILVLPPVSGVGAVLINLFVSSTTAGSGVFLLTRRRFVTGVHSQVESEKIVFHSKMMRQFEVFLQSLPSRVQVTPASEVYHVGPDPARPMATF